MSFTFKVEAAQEIPTSRLYVLDGVLLSGEISHGAVCRIEGDDEARVVIKTVALVNPPGDPARRTLSIEKPSRPINLLVGAVLKG